MISDFEAIKRDATRLVRAMVSQGLVTVGPVAMGPAPRVRKYTYRVKRGQFLGFVRRAMNAGRLMMAGDIEDVIREEWPAYAATSENLHRSVNQALYELERRGLVARAGSIKWEVMGRTRRCGVWRWVGGAQ